MLQGQHKIIDLPVCTEDVQLDQVYEMLCRSEQRVVVVVDSNAHRMPIGIITDRSICEQVVGRRRDLRSLTAANVLDTKIRKLRRAHLIGRSSVPIDCDTQPVIVVDRDRKVVGLYAGKLNVDRHQSQVFRPTTDFPVVPAAGA